MDKGFMHTFEVGNFHLNHLSLFNQELVMYIKRSTDPEELRGVTKINMPVPTDAFPVC